MVQVNGDVTTCCLDEHLVNRLGNLGENTLAELWYGATIEKWRQAQVDGRFEDSGPLCDRCNWKSAGAYPPEAVEKWQTRTRNRRGS